MLTFRIFAILAWCIPMPATACSLAACIGHGIEMDRNFVVAVKHEGKALPGVTVNVADPNGTIRFSDATDSRGIVKIARLLPGDYWLDANFLGINAAYHCLHVSAVPSRKAKRRMRYEWGDFAPATRHIAGKVIDSQPGTSESPLWNLVHRVNVPIVGAKLTLQNPVTTDIYTAASDQHGSFAFEEVPVGLYVLHIEGGGGGRTYEATDLLIRLSPTAKADTLNLVRSEAGGGSCGGPSLELTISQFPSIR